jgi:hypothetical protein
LLLSEPSKKTNENKGVLGWVFDGQKVLCMFYKQVSVANHVDFFCGLLLVGGEGM